MKKLNNKGFSLVELIIVIAIMAILIGVLSPQLMKYIEKSRYSSDCQTIDSAYSAVRLALANEPAYVAAPIGGGSQIFGSHLTTGSNSFDDEVVAIFGSTSYDFKSKAFNSGGTNADINFEIESNGNVLMNVSSYSSDTVNYPDVTLP